MSLPQPDPSLPGGAAPLFGDTDAARGDHLRANNQAIWKNLEYLNAGENINDADAATPVDADRAGFFQIAGVVIKYVTFANLFLWIITKVAALASKATPVDADSVLLIDSEASNVGKRFTWANLKTAIFGSINGLTSKPTPVGDDVIAIGDSTASFAGKKAALNTLARAITQYAKLSDTKAANTSGGTFTSGAWQTRTLNTEDHDDSGIVALSSNQFTLQAGTYEILATAPAFAVTMHKAKLRNVSDSTDIIIGTSEYSNAGLPQTRSKICGRFTIAAAKIFEIQHRCASTIATQGFGVESNFSVPEVYTVVEIWKVA